MNIQPLTKDASKQEEIDLLHKVAKLFPAGTYLASLFSEGMLAWVEECIKSDFSAELYESMLQERDKLWKQKSMVAHQGAELIRSRKQYDAMVQSYQTKVDMLETSLENSKVYLIKYQDRMSLSIDEVRAERNDAKAKLMVAQTEVNRLKVEMYDLTHGGDR